jgi:hypothetical protein
VFDPPRAAAKKKEEEKQKEDESGAAKKKAKKAAPATKERRLPEPWRVTDPAMFHGRGQFSTLFCKSSMKNEKEFPSVEYQMTVVNGKVTSQRYTGKKGADGVFARMARGEFTPDHPNALGMLHCCCYTSLLADFVVLDPMFMSFKQARRTSFYFWIFTGVLP